jgi:choline kinase
MGPALRDRPKCLIELGGKPLLAWQIESLRAAGVSDISAVTGYRGEMISEWIGRGLDRVIENPRYATTNMVASLLCGSACLTEECIISYGDIAYAPEIPRELARSRADVSVVVDRAWLKLWSLRFKDPLSDAESLVLNPSGDIVRIGQKGVQLPEIMGQYIGLIKLTIRGWEALSGCVKRHRLENAYMTDVLQALADEGVQVRAVPVSGNWLEVDTQSDYLLYQRLITEECPRGASIFNIGRS